MTVEIDDIRLLPSFPGYGVTIDGRVFSFIRRGSIGKPRQRRLKIDADGYLAAELSIAPGKKKIKRVHRLVAEVFLPPQPSPTHQIRHLDGIRTHPHADNLAWGTVSENGVDRVRHGHFVNPKLKLKIADVKQIRARAAAGETNVAIARDYPVSAWQIGVIVRRLQWAHV